MNLLMRWRLGGLVRLGSEVVGGGSPRWWALVAGGRGWHLPRMPNGRLVLEARRPRPPKLSGRCAMVRAVVGSGPVSSKVVKQCATAVSWS